LKLFKFILQSFKKIQFHIEVTFLSMLIATAVIILSFSYVTTDRTIQGLSDREMHLAASAALDKVNDVSSSTFYVTSIARGIITKSQNLYTQDLINYFINAINDMPLMFYIAVTLEDGTYLSVLDISMTNITHFITRPNDPLPPGVKLAIRTINPNSTPQTETWQYLDTARNVIATENIEPITYNPNLDPLFEIMKEWPSASWTTTNAPRGHFSDQSIQSLCLSLNLPIFDRQGDFIAQISTSVSLKAIGDYISSLQVGKTGRIFVLDSKGEVVIPPLNELGPYTLQMEYAIVNTAYDLFRLTNQNYSEGEGAGVRYLTYVEDFPIPLDIPWTIVLSVPFNDFFGDILRSQRELLFITAGVFLIFGILVYFFSKHIAHPIIHLANEVDKVRSFDFENIIPVKSKIEEIITLNSSVMTMRSAMRSFGKYVPKEIIKSLIQQGEEVGLGGKRTNLTIMFSDIKDFTAISESLPVELLMPLLSAYFDVLSKIILESEGTIDKYIGDSIMAFWGAPKRVDDHAKKACLTALGCHLSCNVQPKEHRLAAWTTRFGIHTGEVIVGNIGTSDRMNFTIIGDAVNSASRIISLNKQYHTSIIISDSVLQLIGNEFITRPLDYVAVKGKVDKIMVHELVGTKEGNLKASDDRMKLCENFAQAYSLFLEGKIGEAKERFSKLSEQFPEDHPTKIYLERIAEIEKK
jgi:adenylate cyclase